MHRWFRWVGFFVRSCALGVCGGGAREGRGEGGFYRAPPPLPPSPPIPRICSSPQLLATRQCRLWFAQHTALTNGSWWPSPPPPLPSAGEKRYWAVLKGSDR